MKYKYLKTAAALLLLICLFSCSDKEPALEGVWDSVGYGKQMVITDSMVTLYDTYSGGCALFAELPRNVFDEISQTISRGLQGSGGNGAKRRRLRQTLRC